MIVLFLYLLFTNEHYNHNIRLAMTIQPFKCQLIFQILFKTKLYIKKRIFVKIKELSVSKENT